jgi:hypothetical protein
VKVRFLTKLKGMQEMPTQDAGGIVNKQVAGAAVCVKKILFLK